MSDAFRALRVGLAYAEFESSEIAGEFYKLLDAIETDIVNNYEPSSKTEEIIEKLEEAIEEHLETDGDGEEVDPDADVVELDDDADEDSSEDDEDLLAP